MRIDEKEMRPGDILIFRRAKRDYIGLVFSLLIKLFYPNWDMWGWHMAYVIGPDLNDWIIGEATWPCVRRNHLSQMGEHRVYRWFSVPLPQSDIESFTSRHIGAKYDILLYPWTLAPYLVRHFWNKPVPRLLDDRFTCWEYVCEFVEAMGKPIVSKYDCPLIADMQTELEK